MQSTLTILTYLLLATASFATQMDRSSVVDFTGKEACQVSEYSNSDHDVRVDLKRDGTGHYAADTYAVDHLGRLRLWTESIGASWVTYTVAYSAQSNAAFNNQMQWLHEYDVEQYINGVWTVTDSASAFLNSSSHAITSQLQSPMTRIRVFKVGYKSSTGFKQLNNTTLSITANCS